VDAAPGAAGAFPERRKRRGWYLHTLRGREGGMERGTSYLMPQHVAVPPCLRGGLASDVDAFERVPVLPPATLAVAPLADGKLLREGGREGGREGRVQ